MSRYLVLIEGDFRKGNYNYTITRSEPMPRSEAEELFQRVIRGEAPELLKPRKDAVLVRTAENQVCRFWTGVTRSEVMDRITLAEVLSEP